MFDVLNILMSADCWPGVQTGSRDHRSADRTWVAAREARDCYYMDTSE